MPHLALSIILGDRSYQVAPLTLRQVRDLAVLATAPAAANPGDAERASIDRMIAVVAAAIGTAEPDVTADTLLDGVAGWDELLAAYRAVLSHSGMRVAGEAAAGA